MQCHRGEHQLKYEVGRYIKVESASESVLESDLEPASEWYDE